MKHAVSALLGLVLLLAIPACGEDGPKLPGGLDQLPAIKTLTTKLGEATKALGGLSNLDQAKSAMTKIEGLMPSLKEAAAKVDPSKLTGQAKTMFDKLVKGLPDIDGLIGKLPAEVKKFLSGKLGGLKSVIAGLKG
ncbi:MAG: hypothetical protein CSA62_01030 [Planctomycetota bacterium]|nr:MAG: hypothetical protein CSA62_01030 [Planctomycetota bacterium]